MRMEFQARNGAKKSDFCTTARRPNDMTIGLT